MASCVICNKKFEGEHALAQHMRHAAAAHRGRNLNVPIITVTEMTDSPPPSLSKSFQKLSFRSIYTGEDSNAVRSIFKYIRPCKFEPSVSSIKRRFGTALCDEVLECIIEAAKRGKYSDDPGRARQAQDAEDKFARSLPRCWSFRREWQILSGPTPDILFDRPYPIIDGEKCHWIEYKDYFGFDLNPFLAEKNVTQVERYNRHFGPGIIVFRAGFEEGHMEYVFGVRVFWERDLLDLIKEMKLNEKDVELVEENEVYDASVEQIWDAKSVTAADMW